jgi:hypothetical protein
VDSAWEQEKLEVRKHSEIDQIFKTVAAHFVGWRFNWAKSQFYRRAKS